MTISLCFSEPKTLRKAMSFLGSRNFDNAIINNTKTIQLTYSSIISFILILKKQKSNFNLFWLCFFNLIIENPLDVVPMFKWGLVEEHPKVSFYF